MKIVFTFSYKTFSKENTKNYTPNSYVLVFLINVIFFLFIIWDGGSMDKGYMIGKCVFRLEMVAMVDNLQRHKHCNLQS